MNISLFPRPMIKTVIKTASLVSLLAIAHVIKADSVAAMNILLNGGFESEFNNWDIVGDTSIQNTFQGVGSTNGDNQALLTTACPASPFASGECFDTQNPTSYRQDDPVGGDINRVFNQSGLDQADGNSNNLGQNNNLQTFLGLDANALNIDRTGGTIGGTRTPKEGSALTRTFTAEKPFTLSFDWNFMTNDGSHPIFGNQDYSFLTLYPQGSDLNNRPVEILGDSQGAITTPIPATQTDFEKVGGYISYSSELLDPGTYVVGVGVVDVDGTGISSGLLIDNFAVQEVPFDFSATTGLGLVAGIFGLTRWRRRWRRRWRQESNTASRD